MIGQDGDQLVLVLGLEQLFNRAGRQRGERVVGGSEDGERAGTLQGVDQTGGLDGGDEGRERTGTNSGVNNVGHGMLRSW